MKVIMESNRILEEHAEMIAFARAKLIDGYVQLYLRKRPVWLPKSLYKLFLSKILVLAFFKETV